MCLASYFSFFVFIFFLFLIFSCIPVCLSSSCPFVCAAAICYSQQVRIYSTCSFCLCHLYPTPSRIFILFYEGTRYSFSFFAGVFVALISRVAFFLLCSRTRYASTWFAYLDSSAFGFSLSHCLWPHNLYLSRMNQEGHQVGVLLMSSGRKNGLMWRQQQQQPSPPVLLDRRKGSACTYIRGKIQQRKVMKLRKIR